MKLNIVRFLLRKKICKIRENKTFLHNAILASVFLLSCAVAAHAMDTEINTQEQSKYLSRYYDSSLDEGDLEAESNEVEGCRYFSLNNVISFNDDPVYSKKYNVLNEAIKKELDFLENVGREASYKTNFLTVILSATGIKNGKRERVYEHLYIKTGNGNQEISTTKIKDSKILVFSSANSKYYTINNFKKQYFFFQNSKYENSYAYLEDGTYKSYHGVVNLDSCSDTVKGSVKELEYQSNSHTEPLCLSALYTLPNDIFEQLLPQGYSLKYYEIHLMSLFDACNSCFNIINKEIPDLKTKFGPNLFMFYHSNLPCQSTVYKVKLKNKNDKCSQNGKLSNSMPEYKYKVGFKIENPKIKIISDKDNSKLSSQKIMIGKNKKYNTVPPYYFANIRELENKKIDVVK